MGRALQFPISNYGGFGEIVGQFSRTQSTGVRTQSYQVRLSGAFFFGLGALPMPVVLGMLVGQLVSWEFPHCFRRSPWERSASRSDDYVYSPTETAAQITLMKKAAMMRMHVIRSRVGTCGKSLVRSCLISRRVYRQATDSVVARRQLCACPRARRRATRQKLASCREQETMDETFTEAAHAAPVARLR
jgi:hypothetical protein